MNIDKIKLKINTIIERFYISSPPVDVFVIAKELGFSVKGVQMDRENVSGFTDFQGKNIYVNSHDDYYRQAFSVAHELGHLVLHLEIFSKTPEKYKMFLQTSSQTSSLDSLEVEANEFAMNLLVPEKFLKIAVEHYSGNIAIAEYFGVEEWLILKRRFAERL